METEPTMTRYTDIMIDLETLSTRSNAVIVSIGAVRFNLSDMDNWDDLCDPGRSLYVDCDLATQLPPDFHICTNTLRWWMAQSAPARSIFANSVDDGCNKALCINLARFMGDNVKVWGNGCNFDNPIIRNFFRFNDVEFPSPFYLDRDLRTLKDLGNSPLLELPVFASEDMAHNAVNDARLQVQLAQTYYHNLSS